MTVFERYALAHRTMQEGGGAKVTAPGRGGEGGYMQGFQCVQTPPGDGEIFQMLGAGDISGVRRLAGGR